jgi:hypothetical protein
MPPLYDHITSTKGIVHRLDVNHKWFEDQRIHFTLMLRPMNGHLIGSSVLVRCVVMQLLYRYY